MRFATTVLFLSTLFASLTAHAQVTDPRRQLDLEPIPHAAPVVNGDWTQVQLEPVPGLSHAYEISAGANDTVWLAARSRDFPPVIVIADAGSYALPFGSFMPEDGMRVDAAGRPYTWTILDRDGWFVTRVEMVLDEAQTIKYLVGRSFNRPLRYGFGFEPVPFDETGTQGGSYGVATAHYPR